MKTSQHKEAKASLSKTAAIFIFDIGKTNIKGHAVSNEGASLWSRELPNTTVNAGPYPHFDVEAIWAWLIQNLSEAAAKYEIKAINVSTHGACAVLIKENGDLALPVLDYEFDITEPGALSSTSQPLSSTTNQSYESLRPAYSKTLSPLLPLGLNLGRQLYWLKNNYPDDFSSAKNLLMYPQYWVWRLSGVLANEVTSLGCHTDLWLPLENTYSELVDTLDIKALLPPLVTANEPLGPLSTEVLQQTGLPENCQVYPGVHDSNASFARYLYAPPSKSFSVISTGTWIISMANENASEAFTETSSSDKVLIEGKDMLANTQIFGKPLACARFMGGREFEEICRQTQSELTDAFDIDDINQIISDEVFALPSFADAGGPFQSGYGKLIGEPKSGKALASLYLALMIDFELDLLGATGKIVLDSASQKNPLVGQLLAQLRQDQEVVISKEENDGGTLTGAWCLTRWGQTRLPSLSQYSKVHATELAGLKSYQNSWRRKLKKDS